MEKSYGRKLVEVVGGRYRPNENKKARLARVAKTVGISIRDTYAAFYHEYCSAKTRKLLEKAAVEKTKDDDADRIKWIRTHIETLRSVDPEMYRPHIDAAEQFLAEYENFACSRMFMAVPQGIQFSDEE